MLHLRLLYFLCILFSVSHSQSLYNSYGLGLPKSSFFASENGLGSIGLVPNFTTKVSIGNPSTWRYLKHSFVNTTYESQSYSIQSSPSNSESSQFGGIQFLVPIRSKYAIGLSVKPVNNLNTYFKTDTVNYFLHGENLNSSKEFKSGGGVMSSSFAFSLPINTKMDVGFSLDSFFGSSRTEKSLILNNVYYRSLGVSTYKGSKYNMYFSGDLFDSDKFQINVYSGIVKTVKPLSAYTYNFDLFEDIDGDLIPTSNDFPNNISVDTLRAENIYAPNAFSLGLNVDFKNSVNSYFEFQLWNDNSQSMKNLGLFNDQVVSSSHVGAGIVKFGDLEDKDWQDKATLRLGVYRKDYRLLSIGNNIIENGLSMGLGIKFGNTGNQLDLSYNNGIRSEQNGFNETFKQFSIGISVGDVWFLRRRAKQWRSVFLKINYFSLPSQYL